MNEIGTSHLKDLPGLPLALFPDECLPLPASDILNRLSTGPSSLRRGNKWVGCPDLTRASFNGDVERELVAFLKVLGDRVAEICQEAGEPLPHKRGAWTAKFADNGVKDTRNVRKPDLLFGNIEYRWRDIDVHGELKSNDESNNRSAAYKQLLNGAYLMFSKQDNRRFIISIAFMATTIRLYIFDRAGVVTSDCFDLHKDPETFVRVMVAFMFTNDPAVLGYDTSITKTDDGRFIEVAGVKYKIVKTLFISDVVRGRGTVCWHARHGDQDFVIKDTWADDSRPHTEAEILKMAHGVEGVPKVIADVIVIINGVEGTTHHLRSNITPGTDIDKQYSAIERRIHRRLVLTPFGNALPTFATRKELISIFIDVVTAHRCLYEEANILHRDVSINNILLVPSPQLPTTSSSTRAGSSPSTFPAGLPAPGPRRGLLIDVDYALVLNEGKRGPPATGHRTGTLPFMAIDILLKGEELPEHEPRHDLESLLYVLIWVCVHYAGPCDVERQNFGIYESPLSDWVSGSTYKAIGKMKKSTMTDNDLWEGEVLETFAPYFEPLKPCASAWKQLYVEKNLTYDAVLDVLRTALDSLDDVESWSEKDDPEGYGVGQKRKRLGRVPEEAEDAEGDIRALKTIRSGMDHSHAKSDPTGLRPSIVKRMRPREVHAVLTTNDSQ
ncbi:hypothetical protein DFH06DRAFT_1008349 [Mycena polygramma]|nr:hypothetical protein DFH06DRAFT_1008349 [Mycena polygramma]